MSLVITVLSKEMYLVITDLSKRGWFCERYSNA